MSKNPGLSQTEQHTIEVYDRLADERAAQYSLTDYWAQQYQQFKDQLPEAARVIDLGCGDGRDATVFTEMGLRYTGIDLSEGMLKVARKREVSGATFLKRSIYDTGFPAGSFDGFWATSSLVHIPKSKIDEALRETKRIVVDNGTGFIAMKYGEGEHAVSSTLHNDSRVWTFYKPQEFAEILQRNNYKIIDQQEYSYDKAPPYGTRWLLFWVKA